ncbi:hypothetical protein JXO52_09545 [bacterium]|nr:hypothetical protein [bacterium]
MGALFAGLDVSTQSCKLVIIDTDTSAVLHVDAVNYDRDLPRYHTRNGVIADMPAGVSESDPRMWVEAMEMVFGRVSESGIPVREIRCISVSGQQHGLVCLSEKGELTRPASKLWNDFSTGEECDLLTQRVGGVREMIREVGNTQRTGYTAPKILHFLRHEPDAYARTATFFLVHNYINWHLTGGVRVMEPGDVSGTALWHPGTGEWSGRVIEAIDPGLVKKLPPVLPSDRSIGTISEVLAARFGFAPDCLVDAGSGDNMYGAIGTGNVRPGILTISLGTSGTAYSLMEEPFIDPEGEIAAFRDATGRHLPLVCVSNMANGYNRLLEQFRLSHDDFSGVIRRTVPGNGGRIILPWYEGERTPDVPHAAPLYFGFGLDEFSREHLCRGVLEGHILNLHEGVRRLPVQVTEIRLTGGLSRSEAWCQTIADIFEVETVPVEGEGAALGAALHAARVWGKENGSQQPIDEVIHPFIHCDESRRCRPVPEHVTLHRKQKEVFRALSARVRGKTGDDPFALRHGNI